MPFCDLTKSFINEASGSKCYSYTGTANIVTAWGAGEISQNVFLRSSFSVDNKMLFAISKQLNYSIFAMYYVHKNLQNCVQREEQKQTHNF